MLESWNWEGWYTALNKPPWTPGGGTIGTIWGVLYPIIFITYGWVFYKIYKKKIPRSVLKPFVTNLIANFLFTPLFFGAKNINLATIDILIVWITLVWGIRTICKYSRLVAYLQLPYLTWVSIATTLQLYIFFNN